MGFMNFASHILGSSAGRTFFRIALPVARPAIVAGLSLALMEVLNDYGAVKYYGVSTFTTGVMFFLGVSNAEEGWVGLPHSPGYVADERAIGLGAHVMGRVLLDLMSTAGR